MEKGKGSQVTKVCKLRKVSELSKLGNISENKKLFASKRISRQYTSQ
jgi:hypothetical protein